MAEITSGENLTVLVLDAHEATILEDAFDALQSALEHTVQNGGNTYHHELLRDLERLRSDFDQ